MSTPSTQPPVRRARHLIDPTAPPRPRNTQQAQRSLTRVQRWVMSTLAVTTVLHLSAGLILAAIFLEQEKLSSQIGLNVIASAFGVIAVATGLAIHRKPVLSPWLALGLIPGIVGIWLTLR